MTRKETAVLSRTVPEAIEISARWSVGPLGSLALIWCLWAWGNCEISKFFPDFMQLVEFFQEHEINCRPSGMASFTLHFLAQLRAVELWRKPWREQTGCTGRSSPHSRVQFSPFQSPGIPLRPSTSWDTITPRLHFWPAGLCHIFISKRFESFSPDELEIGGPATSICGSALLAVLWGQYTQMTRMWPFNCQEREASF